MAGYQTVAQRNLTCASRIRERRRELGLTQAEVVERVERHGSRLSNQALSAIENGRRLAVGCLPDLAAALDCTVTYLLGLTANPHRWTPDAPADPGAQSVPRPAQSEPNVEPGSEPAADPRPGAAHAPEPALSTSSRSSHGQDVHRAPSRSPRPALGPAATPPHRNWILGPDVPDVPGELRNRAHETLAPTSRRPR